jgi:hypothetical protein
METSIVTQVVERLSVLPDNLQRRVLEYVEALDASVRQGVPGTELLQFAGTIAPDDLRVMAAAIEAGCEQVDVNEW